jgi:hypothetical protein
MANERPVTEKKLIAVLKDFRRESRQDLKR